MSTVQYCRTFPRKNSAQDRLNDFREDLSRWKRKIEEDIEKLINERSASEPASSVNVMIDKFLPNANHLQGHIIERVAEGKRPTDSNLDEQAITRDMSQQPQSRLNKSNDSIQTFVEDSTRRKGKRKKQKPYTLDTEYPSSSGAPNTFNNHENQLSSPKNHRRRKRGIGPQRIANAKKSVLDNILKNGGIAHHPEIAVIRTNGEISAEPPRQTSRNVKTRPFTETKSPKSKQTPYRRQRSETVPVEQESASTFAKFPFSASPRIETKSQPIVAGECTFSFTELGPRVNTFVDGHSFEYDMDVDMDIMDVDFDSLFPDTAGSSNSPTSVPEKWLEKKKEEQISSTMNEIECIRKDCAYLARHESYISDVEMNLLTPCGDLLIVVDTNIFLSHLSFVQRLLKFEVANYKAHVVVVPWVVIQEIDFATKKPNERLAKQAKYSNRFIFECLRRKDPRFFGQSFEDFKVIYKNVGSVDDFLLQYCLNLISLRNNVVFLSDDKNLCNKCMFSHVPAYTKNDFERTFDLNL